VKSHPLLIISAIFAASFAGRVIGVADAALSRPETESSKPKTQDTNIEHSAEPEDAALAHKVEASKTERPAEQTQNHDKGIPTSRNAAQTDALLAAIRERSEVLDARTVRVEDRIRVLEIIEKRVEERITELQTNKDALSSLVAFADEAAEQDIALLSKMYEQMKPKKAGEIFNKMDPTFAAGFLTEMNTESAALILTNMSTDKAYETSMIIASRNAAVHSK
jgi:flagellar motility protein MotE (MotC chaperone)